MWLKLERSVDSLFDDDYVGGNTDLKLKCKWVINNNKKVLLGIT